MMFNKLTILFILLGQIFTVNQNDFQDSDYNAIMKIAKYTSWPETNNNEFVIMIAEDDETQFKMATNFLKNVQFEKKIKTVFLTNETEITDVNLIFIDQNTDIDFEKLYEKIENKNVMTITTNKELLKKGCMFYIETKNDCIDYLFNKQAVKNSGLMIKSSLLAPMHVYEQ